jgi:23S rRNA pseudouridine2605 synthase
VSRLIRIRYGNVGLGPRLFTGHWRDLTEEEIAGLMALAGLPHGRSGTPRREAPGSRLARGARPKVRGRP